MSSNGFVCVKMIDRVPTMMDREGERVVREHETSDLGFDLTRLG